MFIKIWKKHFEQRRLDISSKCTDYWINQKYTYGFKCKTLFIRKNQASTLPYWPIHASIQQRDGAAKIVFTSALFVEFNWKLVCFPLCCSSSGSCENGNHTWEPTKTTTPRLLKSGGLGPFQNNPRVGSLVCRDPTSIRPNLLGEILQVWASGFCYRRCVLHSGMRQSSVQEYQYFQTLFSTFIGHSAGIILLGTRPTSSHSQLIKTWCSVAFNFKLCYSTYSSGFSFCLWRVLQSSEAQTTCHVRLRKTSCSVLK